MANLFDDLPANLPEELVEVLAENKHVRIERIVSTGQASPEGFWYDQEQNEWVILLEGAARIAFEGGTETVELKRGSHLNIPAHMRHRVEWTLPGKRTVWLAIHY